MNKRWLCILFSLLLVITMTACNAQSESASSKKTSMSESSISASSEIEDSSEPSSSQQEAQNSSIKIDFAEDNAITDDLEMPKEAKSNRQFINYDLVAKFIDLELNVDYSPLSANIKNQSIVNQYLYLQFAHDQTDILYKFNLNSGELLNQLSVETNTDFILYNDIIFVLAKDEIQQYDLNFNFIAKTPYDYSKIAGYTTLPCLSADGTKILFVNQQGIPVIYYPAQNHVEKFDSIKLPNGKNGKFFSHICDIGIKNTLYLVSGGYENVGIDYVLYNYKTGFTKYVSDQYNELINSIFINTENKKFYILMDMYEIDNNQDIIPLRFIGFSQNNQSIEFYDSDNDYVYKLRLPDKQMEYPEILKIVSNQAILITYRIEKDSNRICRLAVLKLVNW